MQDLCVNPDNSDVIYAATGQDGVYLTTDGGVSWAANNSGMPAVNISAFSHPWQSGDHWDLLASTTTNSVFKTTVFTPGVGIPDNGNQGNLNVYPNPSNGNLTISLGSLPVKEARAEIYNSAGMLIRVYDLSTPSIHLELSAGIYLCRVISGGVTETARIVVRP